MFAVTRIYESEHAAHAVMEKLITARLSPNVIHASDPAAAASVDAAIDRGAAMSGHRQALKTALSNGRSIVTVTHAFGYGSLVEATMNRGAVDTHTIPDYEPSNPAPFSDWLGLPVLIEGKSDRRLSKFNSSSSFGFKHLSSSATPLSSMFGLKVLSSKKGSIAKGTAVERMSGNPAPFSSLFGLKLLSGKRGSRAEGSSVERMSGNPAPLSSFLGLRVLSKRK